MAESTLMNWLQAEHPNYSTNTNLKFLYSDYPRNFDLFKPPPKAASKYINTVHSDESHEFKSVKLPNSQRQTQILDFWGEGRVIVYNGATWGFPDAYNVNHEFQLVSRGYSDKDKKIPNRIPTSDYKNVSVEKYIPDSSFHIITLMISSELIERGIDFESTATEMARIIKRDNSLIVIYNTEEAESTDIQTIKTKLADKNFVLSPFYKLSAPLTEVGPFENAGDLVFRPLPDVVKDAKKKFLEEKMNDCSVILLSLQENGSANDALRMFFIDDEIRNSYMIFSLGSNLWDSEKGRKLMTDYMNEHVATVVRCAKTNKGIYIRSDFGATSWLCVNHEVSEGNWQYAFFGTANYINDDSTYATGFTFILEPDFDGHSFQIQAHGGATSYLCVDGEVAIDSYEHAFFGTDTYIAADFTKYYHGQFFRFIPINGGEQFKIQAHHGSTSYLAAKKQIKESSYEWAFFETEAYIDENDRAELVQFVE